MTHISVDLDDCIISALSSDANDRGCSISRYVALIIDEYFSKNARKNDEITTEDWSENP